jgi:hypothetical protein
MDKRQLKKQPFTEVKAFLRIWDFTCSHDEITKALGIYPSDSWHDGEVVPGTLVKRKGIGWSLASNLPSDTSIEAHLKYLLGIISPTRSILQSLGQMEIWLVFVVEIYNKDRPPLVIEPDLMQAIAKIGAGFDIDIYNF